MSALGNTFENELVQLIAHAVALPDMGANLYLALVNGDPGESLSLAGELTGNGYARVAIPRDATNWDVVANEMANALDITFPTATGAWSFTHAVLCKASSGSAAIARGATGSVSLTSGQAYNIPAGDLVLSFD